MKLSLSKNGREDPTLTELFNNDNRDSLLDNNGKDWIGYFFPFITPKHCPVKKGKVRKRMKKDFKRIFCLNYNTHSTK